MLLLISLAAIITGIVVLYFETRDYGSPPYKDAPSVMLRVDRAAGLALAVPPLRSGRGIVES
jgi:hypothetical protein